MNTRQLHLSFLLFCLHHIPSQHLQYDHYSWGEVGSRVVVDGQQTAAQLACFPKMASPVAAGTGWARLIIYLTNVIEKENKTKQAEGLVLPEILLTLCEESCRNSLSSTLIDVLSSAKPCNSTEQSLQKKSKLVKRKLGFSSSML